MNQYLLTGDEPLLFHTGMRGLFPFIAGAVEQVIPVASLRWISFGHVEADECGSMNEWLATAPDATIVQGAIGCIVSIGDMADQPPRPLEPGEKLDSAVTASNGSTHPTSPTPGRPARSHDAPPALRRPVQPDRPLPTQRRPPTTSSPSPARLRTVSPRCHFIASGTTIRTLAQHELAALALMRRPVFTGDCRNALHGLADDMDSRNGAPTPSRRSNPRHREHLPVGGA